VASLDTNPHTPHTSIAIEAGTCQECTRNPSQMR